MYNLIVGFTADIAMASRMLEYTDSTIQEYVSPHGSLDPARLINLPTLLMPEVGSDFPQVARIGRIEHLTRTGKGDYRFRFVPTPGVPEFPLEALEGEAAALDIADWEFRRTHWAVKDVDLHHVLHAVQTPTPESPVGTSHGVAPLANRRPARFQVFLSSTFTDLRDERQEVTQALLKMGRCIPAGMELFGASSLPPWEFITRVLDVTDYFVLVLGQRYGSSPPDGGKSYTEREYDYAIDRGIPVLAFMPGTERRVFEANAERDLDKKVALDTFRARVEAAHLVVRWNSADDLAQKVKDALYNEFEVTPRPGWVRGETA